MGFDIETSLSIKIWCRKQESNLRPTDYESSSPQCHAIIKLDEKIISLFELFLKRRSNLQKRIQALSLFLQPRDAMRTLATKY